MLLAQHSVIRVISVQCWYDFTIKMFDYKMITSHLAFIQCNIFVHSAYIEHVNLIDLAIFKACSVSIGHLSTELQVSQCSAHLATGLLH